MGMLFFWEKQLASLRHLFPARKAHPHPLYLTQKIFLQNKIFLAISVSSYVRGPYYFSRRKLMSERSELPFPREK